MFFYNILSLQRVIWLTQLQNKVSYITNWTKRS